MPIHDWTRVDAGLFHAFHHRWIDAVCDALNAGGLPKGFFALPEQRLQGPIPDVIALRLPASSLGPDSDEGGIAVVTAPPRTRFTHRQEAGAYANRANRITVRHRHGEVVAIIKIVSPGNKSCAAEFRAFVWKSAEFIRQGIHLLVVDLFPPGPRDPQGIHKAIWDEFGEDGNEFQLPSTDALTLAAYDAGHVRVAYVDCVRIGDTLPEMPIFLRPGHHVGIPLEATYQTSWSVFPDNLKGLLARPGNPA